MADIRYTVSEIVSLLQKSALPTILVEGVDDMRRYRWMEDALADGVNVMQTGGRDKLFEIYNQRHLFHIPVVFVADRDMLYFSGIPDEYDGIVFTSGYSIENDILYDSAVERLFSSEEQELLHIIESELSRWYAFEVYNCLSNADYVVSYHVARLIDKNTCKFNPSSILPRQYETPPESLVKRIQDKFKVSFRGKNLLDLYEHVLQSRKEGPKYSKEALVEVAIKATPTDMKNILVASIKNAFNMKA